MSKALRYVVFFLAVSSGLPAFAGDVYVQNAAELKTAISSAIADNTIFLQNDINMSGIGDVDIKGKSVAIDGQNHGITSSRNFALVLNPNTNLTIKNVGQVDRDYNIISSFNNNYAKGTWGGPITTQNLSSPTYNNTAKVTIENSVFSNNFAPTDGGAIGLQTIDFDVQNSVFINNSSGQEGGAIWAEVNRGNIENSYFKGNFVRAKGSNTSIGGAIAQYGYYADRPSYIDNISGTFIENYSYNFGGAIANRGFKSAADINKINGDFSANYAIQIGGAILNAAGSINTIDGTFIKNYLLNTSTSSSAVKNSSLLQNNSFGGAIANAGTGGNEATNDSYIKSISGDFIGNFINTKNGKAYGGAIYNSGIIEDISGTFKDNYVFSEGTDNNLALGGAIYSTKDLTITSGKSGTLFSGNYALQNTGERNYNAIYIDNANATLNLTPKSGKTIRFDDNIDGVAGYKVNIKSEYGGTLKLYNDIKNANIKTNDVNIDFVDSKYHNYEFLSLNSSDTTNYLIDFKLDKTESNMQSDTITINNTSASSGFVTLSDIHFIADKVDGGSDYYNDTYVKQILFNGLNGNLQLVLGENLQQTQHKIISTAINDTINRITNASDKYYKNIYTGNLSSSINLATKYSTNDSIELTINGLEWSNDVQKESLGDTFALWLDLETEDEKEFLLAANEQYKINETLNTATAGKLSVIGQSNISSVIDTNNKALFDVSKKSDLTLKNVRVVSAKSDRGSVIKAINPNSSITIDNASFLNNIAAAFGGVFFNASTSNENTIDGIFTANMAGSSGGAIYNQGNIDSIKGEFTSNHTTNSWATGKVVGGAIANKGGTINSIDADFNSNYSDQYGGAIANFVENDVASKINSINGNFNNNHIVVNNSEAFGGAIYNNGTISKIAGNFIGNHIAQDNLDAVSALGGAIYNAGTNDLMISGNFLDNYILVNSSSSALGGAIYTKMNTSIVADNGQNTLFKGNYVQIGNNKNNNAIYVDNAYATLTLNATNHGVISLYDNIDGKEGYDVLITGDNTGVVGLYNDIKNADVKAGKASISLVDGTIKDYIFKSLNTEAETSNIAKWNIDVDLTNKKADTITTADKTSKGTILINNFNIMGVASQDNLVIQVLKNTSGNNDLQLKIAEGVLNVVTDVTNIGNKVFSSKSYLKQDAGISLATTTTTNDSIKFLKDGFYDALQLINQKETTAERKFIFDTAGTHTLLENLGETKSGTLSINGYSNDSSVSVIDLAGKTGFELANGNTTINLNNATLTDSTSSNPVISVTSANNTINLNNAQLKGKITSNSNPYQLNFLGNNVNIDGTVDKANATLNNASTTLTFNTNTFANANLSALAGTINLHNSVINNYDIGTLESAINTLYNIDVDAFNKTSDIIKAGETSTGDVKIGSINFLNGITPQDKNFKVQILETTSTLKLSLSDAIINQLYDFGQVTDTVKDTITTVVNFDDRFYESVKDFVIKGHLSVLDDNKSIGFKDEDMQKVAIAVKEQELLDSLHELSGLNESGKEFNFNTADDVYGAMTDIGTVVNDLTIKGVADSSNNKLSVIGLDNNSGFILNSGSTLNISNVNLRGTNSVITNKGGTLNFNNKNIVNGKLDGTGTATNNGELYIGASNIGLTIDNKNKLYLSEGTLNKTITGSNGETIINSGTLTLGANAKVDGTLNLNGGKMSAVDNNYTEYNINNLVSNGGSYSLDIDLTKKKADTITATKGSGTITLDNLNITGSISNPTADYKIQILKLTDTSSSLQLALSQALSNTLDTDYVLSRTTGVNGDLTKDSILANTSWDTVYKQHQETHDVVTYGKLGLATTKTTNDSIGMNVSREDVVENSQTTDSKLGDTLKLVNQAIIFDENGTLVEKNFTTTDAGARYEVTEDLGTTQGTLNIAGATNGDNKSTIDLNGYNGFVLGNSSTALNLSNVKLTDSTSADKNVITATTSNATIDITDSIIAGNIQGAGNNISFSGVSELNGNITKNINTESANTITNSGTLTANGSISGNVANSGNLTANGAITGDVENSGTFYANSSISGNVTNNANSTLTANGTITGNVTNSGNLTVSNSGSISGNVTNSVNLTANGAITGDVENSGTFYVNSSITGGVTNSGTLTSAIDNLQGSLTNNGTYNMTGTNVTLNKEIAGAGTTVLEQSAILQFGENGKIEGILSLDNNTINMQESGENAQYRTVSIGSLTGTGSLKIDVDLKDGYSDKLHLTSSGSNANLTLTSINVRKDGEIGNLSYLTGNMNGLNLALGTNSDLVSTVTNDYTYTFSLDETKGNLKVVATELNIKPNTLKDFITGQLAISATTYSMTKDITITAEEGGDFGKTPSENKHLYLNLNGHTLNGTLSGEKKGGIVVRRGDQLDISGNETSDKGKISGFSTAISVENGGKLKINKVKLSDNTTDINNSGNLEASDVEAVNIINAENGSATMQNSKITGLKNDGQAYLSGVNEITNIASINDGKGTLNISGNATVSEGVKQGNVLVAESAKLTTALSGYEVNSTQNKGILSLTGDGTISQNISGTNGRLELNGTVTNNAEISQQNVVISGNLTNTGTITSSNKILNTGTITTDASNITATNGIENNHSLTLNGGTLNTAVNGNGTTYITGTVTNNSEIAQAVNVSTTTGKLTINANIGNLSNSGKVIANVDNLKGSVYNSGEIELSGTLNKAIEGSGITTVNNTLTLGTNAKISGTLNLNDKSISTLDGSYTDYDIKSITGSGNAAIDVDWANSKADSFQSTSGDGTLSLSLNQTATADIYENKTIKITSGGVGISLTETTGTKKKTETGTDDLQASVNWTDKFGGWTREDTYSEKISAVKSEGATVNDSIQYEVNRTIVGDTIYTDNLDTLSLIVKNSVTGSDTKTFTTNSSTATYDVTADLGTLRDNLVISGKKDANAISTINIGNHQGITILGNNSLTLKDVKVTSAGTVVNAQSNNAQTTLDNAQIVGNIVNAGNLNLKGNTKATNISGTGSTVVDTLANAQISSLTQNTLSNSGNLTADSLAVSASAENNGILTNNGISSINALTNNTGATIDGSGSLTLSGTSSNKGSITQKNLIISGTAASGISTYALRSRAAIVGSLTNSGTITAENIENNSNIDNTSGTLIGKLTNNGTISGGNITAKDGTVNTGSITGSNLSVEKGFDNKGNISGTINISNSGNLINIGTISGNITNNGLFTSSLDTISNTVVNNGTFKATDGELNSVINGTGTTEITGNVNINGGSFGTSQSISVLENSNLNIGSQPIEINNFTLRGILDITVTNLVRNTSVYEGGRVLVNNADLSGGKLSFTIAQGLLNKGDKTGDLSIIALKSGATGNINGDLSAIFETNNRYEIQQGSSFGTIIIKNKASGEEIASQVGNQNNRNTAAAWERASFALNTQAVGVQEVLNALSQHDKEGFRNALNQVAPSDSQFKLENTRMVQNLISNETSRRFEEEGCTCGKAFKRSSMWMQALGGYNRQSDSFEHQGFKSHTTGYILGYDGSINCQTSLGFGYAYAKSDGKSHSKDMNISSHNMFVYGKYQPLFSYVRGALLYGLADNREKTAIGQYGISSDYDTHYIGAETYVGHEYLNGITPEIGVRYTYLMPDNYTDSLGQKVKNKDISALTLAGRLNYKKEFAIDNGIYIKPEIYAGVTYDMNDTGITTQVSLGQETYTIRSKRVSRFGGEGGVNMSISKENIDVMLSYDTSLKKGYTEQTGMLKFRYNF